MRMTLHAVPPALVDNLRTSIKERGLRQVAREAGVSTTSIAHALRSGQVTEKTLVTLSRIAPRTRVAAEFRGATTAAARHPHTKQGPYSWSLETIRAARDDQMRGVFEQPVRLAESLRTDDALFTAYHNRIAPQSCVQTKLTPASGARGKALAVKASQSVFIARSVLEGITGTLANHGIAIGYNEHEPNETGTRINLRLTEWPLEFVRWNPSREALQTRTTDGIVDIVHGDGRWVVFRKFAFKPWTQDACILPGALIWAAHANAVSDHASASRAHGLAKIMGVLPEGVALNEADGSLTAVAQAFLSMMQALGSGDAVAGIAPPGADTKFLSNGSTAWQVFTELELSRQKAAARVYQGTDAALGAAGGAPGVDIATLFGVASTKVQGDFTAIENALASGVYEPWAAINEGTSRYAPRLEYQLPDPDAAAKAEERAKNRDRLMVAIKAMREQKLEVGQADVDALAAEFGVTPAPKLASVDKVTSTLVLAPTSLDVVVRGREARASQGLPPFGDARDDMTLDQLKNQNSANAEAQVKAAPETAGAPA